MLEMNITIAAPDLAAAINTLAAALDGKTSKPTENSPVVITPAAQPATPTAPVNPTPAPVVYPAQASGTPTHTIAPSVPSFPSVAPAVNAAPASAVPTSAPRYTLDMISTAGATLIDAGKMEQLMQLLDKFGVKSLTELAPENYGAIATELRTLGAAI